MAVLQQNTADIILNQLVQDNRILSSDISVGVSDKTAILTGTVPSFYDKLSAEDDALNVPGIEHVENNIIVSFPEENIFLADNEIEYAVKRMLMWDTRLNIEKIEVSATSGKVTLSGSVDIYWKALLAEKLAFNISGVAAVVNKIAVNADDENSNDERIKKEIEKTILNSSLNARFAVTVCDGRVTLKGKVTDLISKRAITDKVAYTDGVRSINNQIEVV